jgi:hypothetical protein
MSQNKICKHCGNPGYHVFHFPPERKSESIAIIIGALAGGLFLGWITQ